MKRSNKLNLFYILIIIFFVLVLGRAAIIFSAFKNTAVTQNEIYKSSKNIKDHSDFLLKNFHTLSSEKQKDLIKSINSEAQYSLSENKNLSLTSDFFQNFALISMVILSVVFVIIILRFIFKIKKDHSKLQQLLYEKEVIEEKLAKQNEELSKANHELDSFVHSASHDLRAPLASILGLVNILKLSEKEAEQQKLLDMMKISVEKLDFFICDIIEYSRNSRLELAIEKINFEELFADSISQFQYMEATNRIKFDIDVSGNSDFYSDKKRLSVIFNNFISNGIKYYDQRKATPFIMASIVISDEFADIEIRDNGIGISDQYIDKIFDMFYRATQAHTGSGIGLYIVKEVVEKMGGKIHVKSEENYGTSFFIKLPNLKSPSIS